MAYSFEAEQLFPVEYDQLFSKCQEVVGLCRFALRTADPSSGLIEARAGMGAKSWGETITVKISREGLVTVRSKCLHSLFVVDFGKNRANVNNFFDTLARVLNVKGIVPTPATSSPPPPGDDIPTTLKKLAELREMGVITEEEFAQKKRSLLERL